MRVTSVIPPLDDQGFTNDLALAARSVTISRHRGHVARRRARRAHTPRMGRHARRRSRRFLALPGGYRAGWQVEWRVGVDVAWSRYRIAYEYRANEGGSAEPIGVIAFSW